MPSHLVPRLTTFERYPIGSIMGNGHQPLAGDADFISWSQENISDLVATLRGDESSRAQLDAVFNPNEESLLDAHEHGLAGEYNAQPSTAPQAPHGPRMDIILDIMSMARPVHIISSLPRSIKQHQAMHGPSKDIFLLPPNNLRPLRVRPPILISNLRPPRMEAGGGSTVQPPFKASGKREAGRMFVSADGTLFIQKRRRLNNEHSDIPWKFGPYTPSGPSATVMPMPVHDLQPVDISNRGIHDHDDNALKMRKYGVMELEDPDVTEQHPSGLICVRPCDWADQPCDLFVEVDPICIEEHMLHWHGVTMKERAACRFEDCFEPPMQYLSRHIESVHFDTHYKCPYCHELSSALSEY
ncbi:hypothetical protein P692DRAFT_20882448 [Suillus brevipes Sb2]|nr:hypothetical protein P692DRAFT_20882448 [Suillus brevipes Sb2]